jgi:4-amino-4-deoxy-L-arabinose transferase-like glycosyltransferase
MKLKRKHAVFLVFALFSLVFFLVNLSTIDDYGYFGDEAWGYGFSGAILNYLKTGQNFMEGYSDTPYHGALPYVFGNIFHTFLGERLGMGVPASFRVFPLICYSLTLFVVFLFGYELFGLKAGICAFFMQAINPIYLSHSFNHHYDMGLSFFFLLTCYFFYKSFIQGKKVFIFLTALSFALGFSCKFTIALFFPCVILFLVFLFFFKRSYFFEKVRLAKSNLRWWLAFPFLVGFLSVLFYPWLWSAPLTNLLRLYLYYGKYPFPGSVLFFGKNFINGANMPHYYMITQLIVQLPVIVLLLFSSSVFFIFSKLVRRSDEAVFLPVIFFVFSALFMSVGVGVFKTVHFVYVVPFIALICGFAFSEILQLFSGQKKKNFFIAVVCILVFVAFFNLFSLFPLESSYYNFLVGGTEESFGNFNHVSYSEGNALVIDWVNSNVERGASVYLIGNFDSKFSVFRSDIILVSNSSSADYTVLVGMPYKELVVSEDKVVYAVFRKDAPLIRVIKGGNDLGDQLAEVSYAYGAPLRESAGFAALDKEKQRVMFGRLGFWDIVELI